MRSGPGKKHSLETELLFGEKVKIINMQDNWTLCEANLDGYLGWVETKYLSDSFEVNYRVISLRSLVYENDDLKAEVLFYIPICSKLFVTEKNYLWSKIKYICNNKISEAFVPSKDIVPINHKVFDWVSTAELFLNTPYKWGGRDSKSIDCSALIQLSLETIGVLFPRDTKDQVNFLNNQNQNNYKRGALIFWDRHVGVMVDNINIIHANAFHMKVNIEPLNDVKKRAQGSDEKIIKISNLYSN